MRKSFLIGLIVVLLAGLVGSDFVNPVLAAPIEAASRIYGTWNESNAESSNLTALSVDFTDDDFGQGLLIAYLTWTHDIFTPVAVSNSGDFTLGEQTSATFMADPGDGEVDYTLNVATYVYETSGFSGNVSFDFNGEFTEGFLHVIGITGVDSYQSLGAQSGESDYVEYETAAFNSQTLPMGFASIVFPPSQIVPWNDNIEVDQGTVSWISLIETSVFAAIDTENTNYATADFLDGSNNPELTEFASVGYDITFLIGGGAADPIITIDIGPVNNNSSYIYVEGNVNDENGDIITSVVYTINGGTPVSATAVDGTFDGPDEDFTIGPLGPYQNGTIIDLVITATNELDEAAIETFNDLEIQNESPLASCVLSNVSSPTSDQTPTSSITCTSLDGIDRLEYRYYNFIDGVIIDWTEIEALSSGNYGENEVSAEITPSISLPDGNNELKVIAYTGSGRFHDGESEVPVDVFIVEAVDDSPPTIKLNPILPNPITSTSPYITGSCQDVNPFDTNSNIALLQYRIDAGSWEILSIISGGLDSPIENFSFQLPVQPVGEHDVDVRCEDEAEHFSIEGTSFEIIAQPDVEPEEVVITENFTSNDLNSVNETTAIWGNGYIRLKEKIMWNRVALDSNNYPSRYEILAQDSFHTKKYGNDIWYAKKGTLHRYNTSTTVTTNYTGLIGAGNSITDFEYFSSGGNEYVLTSNDQDGLTLHNLTGVVNTVYDITGFDSSDFAPAQIIRDSRSGRIGFFISAGSANVSLDTALFYIDLNNTPSNLGDDTITWYEGGSLDLTNFTRMVLDPARNVLYGFATGTDGLVKIFDNNTPTNIADDTRFEYTIDAIDGMDVDPATGDVYIVTQSIISDLYVLTDGGTPAVSGDDTLKKLTDANGLHQKQATGVKFVAGPEYVGAQLFINTSRGDIIYYNTNGSVLN